MLPLFRAYAVHQARFHQLFVQSWGAEPSAESVSDAWQSLKYDALWLTKFPLLWSPQFDVKALDASAKAWEAGQDVVSARTRVVDLRPAVDADTLRFMLKLQPPDLEAPMAIFFAGRAANKPLWQYLALWFEHSATLRGRLGGPSLFETAFS